MTVFSDIVDEVRNLRYDEIVELQSITNRIRIDFERDELYKSHLESMAEYNKGELVFTSDINSIKNMLKNL